jgi:hypothetical protein
LLAPFNGITDFQDSRLRVKNTRKG